MHIHNFNAGPAILPECVYSNLAYAVNNYGNTGLSLLEISHRSAEFHGILLEAELLLRELLSIPPDFSVIFLAGGASQHFAQIPMNFMKALHHAAYLDTGVWASNAIREARCFGNVEVVASGKKDNYSLIPRHFHIPDNCSYFHYVANNTIYGTELQEVPKTEVPVFCDMSSNILSTTFDITKFSLIYASAQKNIGPAGASIVIVKNTVLDLVNSSVPNIFNYKVLANCKSLFNTPPVLSIYGMLLTLRWVKEEGGVAEFQKRSIEKSSLLYNEIERNDLFRSRVKSAEQRSRINVTFEMIDPNLEDAFLHYASERGIVGIKQYQNYPGFRASLYNALPLESVQVLASTMHEFEVKFKKRGNSASVRYK
ncbi:3-phosphoserine/phosphohydroxythreonine transaminase [Larkinella soli]|uniref:3-phosphoserine/phosphohydroxythreonine transaminase n=1 Tax=Larkinella soli TaxID=1770527 RepID=UPI000FFBC700|nr:3-phosphoserine/phosphohydroxythreonine transaminase [Larkinella soli]